MDLYRGLGPLYEARGWFAATANPYPLASNRFESRAAALAFVDTLYALGADTVYVLNVQQDSAWVAEEGGPYADALLLVLPLDRSKRADLFRVNARESRREGFEPERDRGRRYMYFWWD
jgi:hypothetical protein